MWVYAVGPCPGAVEFGKLFRSPPVGLCPGLKPPG